MNEEIIYTLVHQAAAKQHVTVTPAEVTARLQQIKQRVLQQSPGLTWAQFLYQQGRSEYSVRQNLESRILVEKLVAKTQAPQSLSGKVHLYHILKLTVAVPGGGSPLSDADAKQQITQIAADINSGKISFTDAAKKYSDDIQTKGSGGDLGWQGPDARLDVTFKTAALALKEGEISGPVHSQYGWHLIYAAKFGVHATPQEVAAYAATQQNQQSQQAIPAYVQQLRSSAKITNNLFPAVVMPARPVGPMGGMPIQPRQ
jgi:parvulin-like peptidyl-prolyl isomerase